MLKNSQLKDLPLIKRFTPCRTLFSFNIVKVLRRVPKGHRRELKKNFKYTGSTIDKRKREEFRGSFSGECIFRISRSISTDFLNTPSFNSPK